MRGHAFKAGTERHGQLVDFFLRDFKGYTGLDQVLVRNRVVLRQGVLGCGRRVAEIVGVLILWSNNVTRTAVNFLFAKDSEGLFLKHNSPASGSWLDGIVDGAGGG